MTWTPDGSAAIVSQLEEIRDLVLLEPSKWLHRGVLR